MKIFIYFLIVISFPFRCTEAFKSDNLENVFFAKECDGIYEYSMKDGKEIKIFSINKDDDFIKNPFEYVKGQVQFGVRDRSKEVDSITFFVNYFSINGEKVRTKRFVEKEKHIILAVIEDVKSDQIKIDTFKNCTGRISSVRYLKYNCVENIKERFYSESMAKNGEKVLSRKGDIYLTKDDKEVKLTNFEGVFDSKFGNGFFQPKFIFDENKILFRKLGGLFNDSNEASLYIYDLETKKYKVFSKGYFKNIKISYDGDYMLFSRTKKISSITNSDCENQDIYIMNLITKSYQKIGEGVLFDWKKKIDSSND